MLLVSANMAINRRSCYKNIQNIERGPSPNFLLTRQRTPETEVLNLCEPTQQKLYMANPCVLNFRLILKHYIESLTMVR